MRTKSLHQTSTQCKPGGLLHCAETRCSGCALFLSYPMPMTSLRSCALITSPFLVLNWYLRLGLDAVLVIQRFLAVLWNLQLANADIAFSNIVDLPHLSI